MAEKLTVFISGTMRDLSTERERVARVIHRVGHEPLWAEKRGATDRASRDECERMARTCHVYLGLYGLSYGWKFPPEETLSATEFEWQAAKRAGKPMLIYRQKGDPDPEQAAFLKRVGDWQQGRFWYEFETLDDLLPRLRDDLARLIAESFRPERPALMADYRAHLRRLYADLPLSGIPVPLDVTLPLDRVYIKLRALPEREEALRREDMLPSDRDEELSHKLAERLWQQQEQLEEWEKWDEIVRHLEEMQPISPEEAIAQHDHLVILGEAGAGKSTLLHHLAWERTGAPEAPLPLLVSLGRADALISQTGRSFLEAALDLLTEHRAGEGRELLKQALADAIQDKTVLFLCDGLDEVHLARQSLVAGLEKLAADGQQLAVTSRPLGYERLAGVEHFQVLPLLPEDAQAFSDRWFRALAQARGVPRAERERWAAERAGWLQRQLDERPGLREVARSPLLLTFLAVLAGDEPQRDLPPRRKELYREYMERLLTVWEARRQREGALSLGRLRGEEAHRVALWGLYRTAWHLHRAYYGDERMQAVRGEVEPLLARDLRERWEFGLLQAEALATEVLLFWEGAGLLDVYRLTGQEWLAFRHLTFQEYGAARALSEMYEDSTDGLWQCLSPHLLRPQWAGVIPLTLAHLSGARATNLVERLLAANKGDEEGQRPLLLSAAALAEGAEVTDALQQRVVDALLNLAQTRSWGEWRQKASAMDAMHALGRLVGDRYAAVGLLALARDRAINEQVQVGATEALGELGCIDELLALARDWGVGDWVRVGAAEALGGLGRPDTLLNLARDSAEAAKVRMRAAMALWRLRQVDEAADALLALVQGPSVEVRLRTEVAAVLGKLGRAGEAAKGWLALAQDQTLEARVRAQAAAILGKLGRPDEMAKAWLALAQDRTLEARVRAQAAAILGKLGRPDEMAEAWSALARDEAMVDRVRYRAAEALGELGRADKAAEILLALARDRAVETWVQEDAAAALGRLGRATPEVLAGLWALVEEPETPESVRRVARKALERLEK